MTTSILESTNPDGAADGLIVIEFNAESGARPDHA